MNLEMGKERTKWDNYSVPFWRRIRNCSGERMARHSSSDFSTTVVEAAMVILAAATTTNTDPTIPKRTQTQIRKYY